MARRLIHSTKQMRREVAAGGCQHSLADINTLRERIAEKHINREGQIAVQVWLLESILNSLQQRNANKH